MNMISLVTLTRNGSGSPGATQAQLINLVSTGDKLPQPNGTVPTGDTLAQSNGKWFPPESPWRNPTKVAPLEPPWRNPTKVIPLESPLDFKLQRRNNMSNPDSRSLPPIPFLTSKDSPFPDGYDIEAERRVLKDLIEADDPDSTDPRYLRLLEYYERQMQLDQKHAEYRARGGAEAVVNTEEARSTAKLGAYTASAQNTVTLHTKEAYRLFTGRAKDPVPGRSIPPILGARRAGSMLRSLWLLSSNDNPYADWALIDVHGRITDAIEKLNHVSQEMEQQTKALRQRGIAVHIVEAREPQTVPLGFASPYAFLLVEMLAEFDYFIRMVKTMESISRLGSDEAKKKNRNRGDCHSWDV